MTKITKTAAALTAAIMTLTVAGCSYPGSNEQPGAAETPTPTEQPTESPTPEDGTSDPGDPDELTATVTPAPEDEVATIELGADGSTLYLRPIQAFSPELESWSVNADHTEVHYMRHSCLGVIEAEAYGSLAVDDSWTTPMEVVTWAMENPIAASTSPTTPVEITDTMLTPVGGDAATAHTDVAQRSFESMCVGAGELIADFIF